MNVAWSGQAQAPKRRIVLIHGAWHGGWCWSLVKPLLEAAGYAVTSPSLTGLGERRHLISRSVDLTTHIRDVVQHVDDQEMTDVILVGHSYGGFVATGAVEILRQRVAHLVLLDAFFPDDGERILDYAPEPRRVEVAEAAARDQAWNIAPPDPSAFGVIDAGQVAWVKRHLGPHPVGSYLQPIAVAGATARIARRSYISCDEPAMPVLHGTRQRLKADSTWRYVSVPGPHDIMITHPTLLADTLLGLLA